MAHQVQVNRDFLNLPNGFMYRIGATPTLSDEEFAKLASDIFTKGLLTDLGVLSAAQGISPTQIGSPFGVASLDSTSQVPANQLGHADPAGAATAARIAAQSASDPAGTATNAIATIPADGTPTTPSLRTLGTGANQAASGNDSRIVNAAQPGAYVAPGQVPQPEITDFTTKVSVPTVSDTGQAVNVTGNGTWAISNSALAVAAGGTGTKAPYFQRNVNGLKVTYIERTFRFPSAGGSTNGAAIGLITWAGQYVSTIPDGHCHCIISRTGWTYYVLTGGAPVVVASGTFKTVLPLDTVLTAAVTISGNRATLRLPGPDSVTGLRTSTVDDTRIGSLVGTWAVDEIYLTNAATDYRIEILRSVNRTDGQAPPNIQAALWTPADNGLIGANFQPRHISTALASTAGVYFAMRVKVPAGAQISNVCLYVWTAGAGLTAGTSCIAGLYDVNGTRLGLTADQATNWQSTGFKAMALLTTPPPAPADTWYYVVWCAAGSTLPLLGVADGAKLTANLGLSGGQGAGYQAGSPPLPASIVPGSLVDYFEFWAAVS